MTEKKLQDWADKVANEVLCLSSHDAFPALTYILGSTIERYPRQEQIHFMTALVENVLDHCDEIATH